MINNSNKIINSKESILYIDNDIIHKIFKDNINKENRIKTIELFLNTKIDGCPEIVDFIYDNNNDIIGYTMKYYKNAINFSPNMKFKFKKEKCQELIDIYLKLKNNYNLLYSDFHNDNIFINNLSILLLDIDSCIEKTKEKEIITDRFLCDYVLGILYKTNYFYNEIYYSNEEREIIRKYLYRNNEEKLDSINDLKLFLKNTNKSDIKKVLKKIPYGINN